MILNLLEANCPLDESIDSMTIESLMFHHSQSNRDTAAGISQGDRGAISLGEEIHEEARRWMECSVFIPVDNVGYIVRTSHYFICSSSTTLASCNAWTETDDNNKTERSYKVHNIILDDNGESTRVDSKMRQWTSCIHVVENTARMEIYTIDDSWILWFVHRGLCGTTVMGRKISDKDRTRYENLFQMSTVERL